jgi:hypothetical protein
VASVRPEPPHRNLGIVLVAISIVGIVVGAYLMSIVVYDQCQVGVLGYCALYGPVHPYYGLGIAVALLCALLLGLGVVLLFYRPEPERFVPAVPYYPPGYAAPPPVQFYYYPPPPPTAPAPPPPPPPAPTG